ncbi:pRL2-19 (plasmid) [Streptomyces olivoreticuli]|uniref:pRL2-19 n=1 Tax=Streptomyces olivoreticuli TaxID=68246 RepID=UPI002657E222|nr:pRL2-19 [Streptomyces olivoreticuli]WKK27850.1 pRL2-19 [Streptomyces olivoreticuli]
MENPTPAEMSHAMLIAVLMHHGGSITMPAAAFAADATGTADGTFHAVELLPFDDGTVRLSVVPRPSGDGGGIEWRTPRA